MSSIVVNRAGEWKLTGFEYTHGIEEQNPPMKVIANLDSYEAPEKSPVLNLKSAPNKNTNTLPSESRVDSWGLGCLIWEIFNGLLPNSNALKNPGKVNPKKSFFNKLKHQYKIVYNRFQKNWFLPSKS